MKADILDRLIADWAREREDLDASAMGIVGRILILGERFGRRIELRLKPFGLGYTDFDVLATLRRSGEPYALRPAQLLETVLIASGSMTACLDRLEKADLVERLPAANDRRGRVIHLTAKGRETVDQAISMRFREAAEAVAVLKPAQQAALTSLLRTLSLSQDRNDNQGKGTLK